MKGSEKDPFDWLRDADSPLRYCVGAIINSVLKFSPTLPGDFGSSESDMFTQLCSITHLSAEKEQWFSLSVSLTLSALPPLRSLNPCIQRLSSFQKLATTTDNTAAFNCQHIYFSSRDAGDCTRAFYRLIV